jgi:hypothetical protein
MANKNSSKLNNQTDRDRVEIDSENENQLAGKTVETDQNIDGENGTEENFDKDITELLRKIVDKIGYDKNMLIIFQSKSDENPVVYMNGHPFDVAAMAAGFLKDLKSKLVESLDS